MIAQEEIKQIIFQLEKLEQDKANIVQTISDAFAEARVKGYDVKILRQLLKLRKIDSNERIRQKEELEIYKAAIGIE